MVYTFISLISRFLNKKCMELHLASKVSYSRELNHLYNIINDPLTKRSKKVNLFVIIEGAKGY
jgi:transposase